MLRLVNNSKEMKKYFLLGIVVLLIVSNEGFSSVDPNTDSTAFEQKNTKAVKVYNTFYDRRVVNGQSMKTLWRGELDIRIGHRFGDMLTDWKVSNVFHNWAGLDQSTDIRIGAEYGLTNNVLIGLGRCKGSGPYKELFDGFVKHKILAQTADNSMPISLAYVGSVSLDASRSSNQSDSERNYAPNFARRFAYAAQILIARKFGERLSLQLSPSYVHRNMVHYDDQNGVLACGIAGKIQVSKMVGIIGEYFLVFRERNVVNNEKYFNPLSLALELMTGGHTFQINFVNAGGIGPTQFIPYTNKNWGDGNFRMGFTISRVFKL